MRPLCDMTKFQYGSRVMLAIAERFDPAGTAPQVRELRNAAAAQIAAGERAAAGDTIVALIDRMRDWFDAFTAERDIDSESTIAMMDAIDSLDSARWALAVEETLLELRAANDSLAPCAA